MNNIFDTIAFLWSGTLRPAPRLLGLVILAGAVVSATACGSDARSQAGSIPTTTASATTSHTTGQHIEIDQPGVVIDEVTHLLP